MWRYVTRPLCKASREMREQQNMNYPRLDYPCSALFRKLLPSARHERRVGAFLVRAAWERRPEGPAYLLPLLCSYISPASVLSYAHAHPLGSVELGEGFSRVPTIPDLSPLTVFSSGRDPQVQSSSLEKAFFCLFSGDSRARRRPRRKLLCFWVWLVVRSRDRATPPTM